MTDTRHPGADPLIQSACALALDLFGRAEVFLDGHWTFVAWHYLETVMYVLAKCVVHRRGAQPELFEWMQSEHERPPAAQLRGELRAALTAGDILRAVVVLADLQRRVSADERAGYP